MRGRLGVTTAVSAIALAVLLAACDPQAEESTDPGSSDAPVAAIQGWRTDFGRVSEGVDLREFVRAAPGRDAIPALADPNLTSVTAVDWIGPDEPVIAVEVNGTWRAYPLQIMLWHEIVNDELAGRLIAVTFCPLCHTSVVFDRHLDGAALDFGVTGYLRRSDLVMYDRQTESWWQQATGIGLIGNHAGAHLEILPSSLVAWKDFAAIHPDGTVLDRATGYSRPYGRNPYPGWDLLERNPFLGSGQLEPCADTERCLDPKERVGVVTVGTETAVYPFRRVAAADGLVTDVVGGVPIVVWWLPDVQTVLGSELLARGDQVGTLVAFDRRVNGVARDLVVRDGFLTDPISGQAWDALGQARADDASDLARLQIDTPYWFGFAAFGTGYRVWGE